MWEHQTIEFKAPWTWGGTYKFDHPGFVEALNKKASQGWELVSTIPLPARLGMDFEVIAVLRRKTQAGQ